MTIWNACILTLAPANNVKSFVHAYIVHEQMWPPPQAPLQLHHRCLVQQSDCQAGVATGAAHRETMMDRGRETVPLLPAMMPWP
jgi:hypothetical protein